VPANRRSILEIVLRAKNLTAAPFAAVRRALARIHRAGVAAFSAMAARAKMLTATLFSMAVPLGLIQSIRLGVNLEADLAKVGTLSQAATDRLGEFKNELQTIAATSGTPIEELTDALFNMVSAGVAEEEVIHQVTEANRLAIAGYAELSNTVLAMTKVMNVYGLATDQARHAAEVLFATQKIGQTDVAQVAQNFPKVTATAKVLGLELEQLGAAFAQVTLKLANSEEAATALRASFSLLQKPSADLKSVYSELGLTIETLFDNGRTLGDVWSLIIAKSREMGMAFADIVPNVRALPAVVALMNREGAEFNETLVKFRDGLSRLTPALEDVEKTTKRTLMRFKEFLKVLGTRFAVPFMAEINERLKFTNDELAVASIRAEILGNQFLLWGKKLEPVWRGFMVVVSHLSAAVKLAWHFGRVIGAVGRSLAEFFIRAFEGFTTAFEERSKRRGLFATWAGGVKDYWAGMFKTAVKLGELIVAIFKDAVEAVASFFKLAVLGFWGLGATIASVLLTPLKLAMQGVEELAIGIQWVAWKIAHPMTKKATPTFTADWIGDFAKEVEAWQTFLDKHVVEDIGGEIAKTIAALGDDTKKALGKVKKQTLEWLTEYRKSMKQAGREATRLMELIKGGEVHKETKATFDAAFKSVGDALAEANENREKFFEMLRDLDTGDLVLGAAEFREIQRLNAELKALEANHAALKKHIEGRPIEIILQMSLPQFHPDVFQQVVADTFSWSWWREKLSPDMVEVERVWGTWFNSVKEKVDGVRGVWNRLKETIARNARIKAAFEHWTMTVAELEEALIRTAQGALAQFFDSVAAGTANANDAFKAMLRAMLSALNKFMADRIVWQFLRAFGFEGGPTPGPMGTGTEASAVSAELAAKGAIFPGPFTPIQEFAQGGIAPGPFTQIQEFAQGGIVRRPTLGLIGEAGQNEAIVPLPDGKAIPVEMTGGGDSFAITINAMDSASVSNLLLSDNGQRAIVAAFQNARATRVGFQR